jgi:hypothetical protein
MTDDNIVKDICQENLLKQFYKNFSPVLQVHTAEQPVIWYKNLVLPNTKHKTGLLLYRPTKTKVTCIIRSGP